MNHTGLLFGRSLMLAACVAPAVLTPTPAVAWNGVGHEVVARVAWNQLDAVTKAEAVRLLLATRPEVELTQMRPVLGGRRDQILFERAATWPDYVRSQVPDENRPGWHYTNLFWKQVDGRAVDLPEMRPAAENVLTELPRLLNTLADSGSSDHDRGVALAWVLHLIGDLHQPLHCSARVTDQDPRGDRGGNSFKLAPEQEGVPDFRRDNLHSLWDGALSRLYPQKFWESDWRYRQRLLAIVVPVQVSTMQDARPAATFDRSTAAATLMEWVEEGFAVAKRACYPAGLVRNQPASASMLGAAAAEAQQRMLWAGERLAAVLEAILATDG